MYYCNDCKKWFNEPETYTETVGEYWGFPAEEEFACCPHCNSWDFISKEEYEENEDEYEYKEIDDKECINCVNKNTIWYKEPCSKCIKAGRHLNFENFEKKD